MISESTDSAPFGDAKGSDADPVRRPVSGSRHPSRPQRARGPRPPSRATLATALNGVSEAVVVTDRDGFVRSLHGTARKLLPGLGRGADIASFLTAAPDVGISDPRTGGTPHRTVDGTVVAVRITRVDDSMVFYVARPQVEQAVDALHLEFLNEAARQLSSSLQLERATHLAPRLPVSYLAGACCYFALRREGGADWICASAAPDPRDVGIATGRWEPAASGAQWLSDLADGYKERVELYPEDLGAALEETLPASLGRPGPMLAVPVRGVTGVIGALLFARSSGEPGYTGAETEVMTEYAERVGMAIRAATLYQDQVRTADRLKSALAPAPLPDLAGLSLGSAYRSARQTDRIGGDYYEVIEAEDGVEFLFGDVSGKGIDAAVLTGMVRQSMHALRLLERRPLRLLELLNEVMLTTGPEKFSTMILGRALTLGDGGLRVEAAAGGHPPPLVFRADGTVEEVELSGMFVGALQGAEFDSVEFTVHPGELLLMYSDGVTEARNDLLDGEMFGEERLTRLLADCAGLPAAVVAERIEQVVEEWLGGGQHDDITVLVLQPGGSRPAPSG